MNEPRCNEEQKKKREEKTQRIPHVKNPHNRKALSTPEYRFSTIPPSAALLGFPGLRLSTPERIRFVCEIDAHRIETNGVVESDS